MSVNLLLVSINWLGFAAISIWIVTIVRRSERGSRLQRLARLGLAMTLTLLMGSTLRWMLLNGVGPQGFGRTLGVIVALFALLIGIIALRTLPSIFSDLHSGEILVRRLSSRIHSDAVSRLGLTPRELEVLEVMTDGVVTDDEIADSLNMAPATAGTHVRNLMGKAGVSDRRDLILLNLNQ